MKASRPLLPDPEPDATKSSALSQLLKIGPRDIFGSVQIIGRLLIEAPIIYPPAGGRVPDGFLPSECYKVTALRREGSVGTV